MTVRRRSYREIFRLTESPEFDVRTACEMGRVTVELWRRSPERLVASESFEADSEGYMTTGQFAKAAWYAHGLVSAIEAAA